MWAVLSDIHSNLEALNAVCDDMAKYPLVNVGSVGQPRDGDWRACYVLVDGWDITFRRVEYDVDATVAKIYAIPELPNFLGDRLREGR